MSHSQDDDPMAGAMEPGEVDAFRSLPGWEEGVRLREWDDDAKVWDTPLVPLEHFLSVLQSLLKG